MISAYRIVKRKYIEVAFTGKGARDFGGRWNSVGTSIVYAAESQSLAVLETLVHTADTSILPFFVMLKIKIPSNSILHLDTEDLPENWRENPSPPSTAKIGDYWKNSGDSLALSVPSTILPTGDRNILINPQHEKANETFEQATEVAFAFDDRLIK